MNYKKLSIIIPCYNAASYLEPLLRGLFEQINEYVEIIIVDDCSIDNTVSIIDFYSQNNSGVIVIKNKVNEGISISRNKALARSSGEYIWFIDSDDLIGESAISSIFKEISVSKRADIINFSNIIIKTELEQTSEICPPLGEYNKKEFMKLVLQKKFTFHLWNKVISRKLIGSSQADINISILVDMNFLLNVIRGKDFILKSVPDVIYKYYFRPGSTITKINQKKLIDQQYTFNIFIRDCEALNDSSFLEYLLKERISTCYQVVRNKGYLIIERPNVSKLLSPHLNFKERYKLLYILLFGMSEHHKP